jgi:hypothetical protein
MSFIDSVDHLNTTQQKLSSSNIQFHYYPIECQNIQRNKNRTHCIYRGNANQPNITYSNNNYFSTHYQSSDLYIFPSSSQTPKNVGELVIKHTPLSSSVMDIYTCFALQHSAETPTTKTLENINKLVSSTNGGEDYLMEELDLSPFFKKEHNSFQTYETLDNYGKKCLVVIIASPIPILTDNLGFTENKPNPLFLVKHPMAGGEVGGTNKNIHTLKEGFVKVNDDGGGGKTGYALEDSNNNQMECEIVNDTSKDTVDVYQVAVGSNAYSDMKKNETYVTLFFVGITIAFFLLMVFGGPIFLKIIQSQSVFKTAEKLTTPISTADLNTSGTQSTLKKSISIIDGKYIIQGVIIACGLLFFIFMIVFYYIFVNAKGVKRVSF